MGNEQSFNGHDVLSFEKLTSGNADEIRRLEKEFESHGWCFVYLSNEKDRLSEVLQESRAILMEFFKAKEEEKNTYQSSNAFGYSRVGHKEGIKVLTNKSGLSREHKPLLSRDVQHAMTQLAVLLRRLTDALQSVIIKMPVIAQSRAWHTTALSPLTMLDVVHYFNQRQAPAQQPDVGLSTDEVNCVPHFDPGLFSLSILSTGEGLQLKDQLTNSWVNGPVNSDVSRHHIGVIWLGEAASLLTNNRFKSGIHRVVYPQAALKPRLTIWQEVCTVEQIAPLLHANDSQAFIPEGVDIQLTNQPGSRPLRVKAGGENRNVIMKRIEHDRGISVSKAAPRHMNWSRYLREDGDAVDDNSDSEDPMDAAITASMKKIIASNTREERQQPGPSKQKPQVASESVKKTVS